MKTIVKNAIINALTAAIYIAAVGSFFFYAPNIFNQDVKTVIVPIFMLLLLVFSVALMGVLVFGRPALWYLEGKKKESLYLLGTTLVFLFIITLLAFLKLYLFTK